MKAGDLKHNVAVQSYTETKGDRGQSVKTWATVATVRAAIEPLTGRKLELARQQVTSATHKVTLRYLAGLTVECRILYGSRLFYVGSVVNKDELSFTTELLCTEQLTGA